MVHIASFQDDRSHCHDWFHNTELEGSLHAEPNTKVNNVTMIMLRSDGGRDVIEPITEHSLIGPTPFLVASPCPASNHFTARDKGVGTNPQ